MLDARVITMHAVCKNSEDRAKSKWMLAFYMNSSDPLHTMCNVTLIHVVSRPSRPRPSRIHGCVTEDSNNLKCNAIKNSR